MLLTINDNDPSPVYTQIVNQIKEQIQRSDLKPGDELPSIRELAASLGINMHTVRHAYNMLREQGLLVFRLGQQAKVAEYRIRKASHEEIETKIGKRMKELIMEAFLLGLSADDFRNLVNAQMKKQGDKE